MKRTPTNYKGVYERVSSKIKHNGKADRCFDITYKHDGKKIWEKCGWASEGYSAKRASEIRAERLRSIRHGEELPRQKKKAPLFKDVVKKYFTWAEVNKKQKGKDDKHRYKNHLIKFAERHLNEISSFDLERFKADLIERDYAPATIKHCLALLRQIYNKAFVWGLYTGDNPVKGVKMPTVSNERQRFLSYDEAKKLLDKLNNDVSHQLYAMSVIALHCGLRAGEIFDLKGQHLDFRNDIITVADPKNNRTRHAYMTEAVKAALLRHVPESPDGCVFTDQQGKKFTEIPRNFRTTVNDLGFNEGITDPRQRVTFHSLRHTFASWLALQGEQLLVIKELMGHKTLVMVQRYTHLLPDHKRQAALRLEKSFNAKKLETESGSNNT